MIKVSTTGMAVSLITDLRFPTPGQQGHGRRIIQADAKTEKQKVQEITEKLEQGIKELFESEKYKTYLNTIRK